jgi:hypothetical protein
MLSFICKTMAFPRMRLKHRLTGSARGEFGARTLTVRLKSSPLFFYFLDRVNQPIPEYGFALFDGGATVQRFHSFSQGVQRNVPTGNTVAQMGHWNKLHEDALAARPGRQRVIKIGAGGRVFKNQGRSPGSRGQAVIPTTL